MTKALKKASKTAQKWTRIDVDAAAAGGRFPRANAVNKLQEWNDSGAIELHPSGVVNRFRVMRDFFPQGGDDEAAKNAIINSIYALIEAREKSDMQRVKRVIELVTSTSTAGGCLSRELARHFGDEDTVPRDGCGHCNFCITGTRVEFLQETTENSRARIDEKKIKAILAATNVRDDARFLARVAFGISSPRVTKEKLGKHEVFGSMTDCDFEVCPSFPGVSCLFLVLDPDLNLALLFTKAWKLCLL